MITKKVAQFLMIPCKIHATHLLYIVLTSENKTENEIIRPTQRVASSVQIQRLEYFSFCLAVDKHSQQFVAMCNFQGFEKKK